MTQKILILMSNTGGGHRASAEALRAGFYRVYDGRFEITIVDLLSDYLPVPLRRLPNTYPFLIKRTPHLWGALWHAGDRSQQITEVLEQTLVPRIRPYVHNMLAQHRPDLLISVHPLMQHVALHTLRNAKMTTPFVTVVTDLETAHRTWFHPDVTLCFVPSPILYARARALGLSTDQVRLTGLPVRPEFAEPVPAGLPQRLGLHPTLPVVLVIGGGDGVGKVSVIVNRLSAALSGGVSGPVGQIVVICGRNRQLQKRLAAHEWPLPVTVLGFVDNMQEWMHAADCVVTKAGPGTIAEALICGRPLILSSYIPGQEEGNIGFVVRNQAGVYCPSSNEIAQVAYGWLTANRGEYLRTKANAQALGRPLATQEIVTQIAALLPDPA